MLRLIAVFALYIQFHSQLFAKEILISANGESKKKQGTKADGNGIDGEVGTHAMDIEFEFLGRDQSNLIHYRYRTIDPKTHTECSWVEGRMMATDRLILSARGGDGGEGGDGLKGRTGASGEDGHDEDGFFYRVATPGGPGGPGGQGGSAGAGGAAGNGGKITVSAPFVRQTDTAAYLQLISRVDTSAGKKGSPGNPGPGGDGGLGGRHGRPLPKVDENNNNRRVENTITTSLLLAAAISNLSHDARARRGDRGPLGEVKGSGQAGIKGDYFVTIMQPDFLGPRKISYKGEDMYAFDVSTNSYPTVEPGSSFSLSAVVKNIGRMPSPMMTGVVTFIPQSNVSLSSEINTSQIEGPINPGQLGIGSMVPLAFAVPTNLSKKEHIARFDVVLSLEDTPDIVAARKTVSVKLCFPLEMSLDNTSYTIAKNDQARPIMRIKNLVDESFGPKQIRQAYLKVKVMNNEFPQVVFNDDQFPSSEIQIPFSINAHQTIDVPIPYRFLPQTPDFYRQHLEVELLLSSPQGSQVMNTVARQEFRLNKSPKYQADPNKKVLLVTADIDIEKAKSWTDVLEKSKLNWQPWNMELYGHDIDFFRVNPDSRTCLADDLRGGIVIVDNEILMSQMKRYQIENLKEYDITVQVQSHGAAKLDGHSFALHRMWNQDGKQVPFVLTSDKSTLSQVLSQDVTQRVEMLYPYQGKHLPIWLTRTWYGTKRDFLKTKSHKLLGELQDQFPGQRFEVVYKEGTEDKNIPGTVYVFALDQGPQARIFYRGNCTNDATSICSSETDLLVKKALAFEDKMNLLEEAVIAQDKQALDAAKKVVKSDLMAEYFWVAQQYKKGQTKDELHTKLKLHTYLAHTFETRSPKALELTVQETASELIALYMQWTKGQEKVTETAKDLLRIFFEKTFVAAGDKIEHRYLDDRVKDKLRTIPANMAQEMCEAYLRVIKQVKFDSDFEGGVSSYEELLGRFNHHMRGRPMGSQGSSVATSL